LRAWQLITNIFAELKMSIHAKDFIYTYRLILGSILSAKLPNDKMIKFVERIKAFSQSDFGSSEANFRLQEHSNKLDLLCHFHMVSILNAGNIV
jgi:hypothetical protein